MIRGKTSSKSTFILGRVLLLAGILSLIAVCIFCCFYLFANHELLVAWYTGLNPCFYHSEPWKTDFFTPGIKSDGNMYCGIALVLSAGGLALLLKKLIYNESNINDHVRVNINKWDVPYILICIFAAVGLWLWGNNSALAAFDEVFSAQHIADIHPFQGVSYYMLPNNHLFFNFLNNTFFHYVTDKVMTGRIISLVAYCATLVTLYFALIRLVKYRWLSLLTCLTLALQFFVWGFSFQARGYELYLLAEWGMFLSLFAYIKSGNRSWLHLNVLPIAVGYFCMPSFLYFHAAQLLFMFLYCIVYKRKETSFWKYQAIAILATYICYLPTLSFSGIEAITNNGYVAPSKAQTISVFWQGTWPMMKVYFAHIFSDMHLGIANTALLLLSLPIILITARRQKILALSGLFYLCLWVTFFIITTVMKRAPFERNLIGHYSMSLAGVLVFLHWLIGTFRSNSDRNVPRLIIFPVVLLAFSSYFFLTNEQLLKDTLYEYNVNEVYIFHKDRLNIILPGSTVGFSDAEFYSYYLCRKNSCVVNKCPDGSEDYFVTQDNEGYPAWLEGNYRLVDKRYNYEIYRRK